MAPKTRRYDHARIQAAVTAQFGHVARAVAGLTPDQLDRPSGLGEWSVAELAAHMAWIGDSLAACLARPPAAVPELTAVEWPFATASLAGKISEAARETLTGARCPSCTSGRPPPWPVRSPSTAGTGCWTCGSGT
ncbi:hypothetical protein SF23_13180 [Streptomyces sp. MBRL 10]|nr:hypothetical protein SF23_13180 [Streptomyces sp. MBRL 10]